MKLCVHVQETAWDQVLNGILTYEQTCNTNHAHLPQSIWHFRFWLILAPPDDYVLIFVIIGQIAGH